MTGSPPNEVFSAFAFIGFVISVIPFYWHLEAWNTGTCLFMFWSALGCLVEFINSVVWNKNIIDSAPVYCDIASRILVAMNSAIPAASLCINRRLYKIATIKSVTVTPSEKRRTVLVDLLIGLGLPILQMIAQHIVSSHRYALFEDLGPTYINAYVVESLFLFCAWPVVIGCVSFVYCALTIYTLIKRERQFSEVISSNRGLNRGRYIRLMVLAGTEACCTIPLGMWVMSIYWKAGLRRYTSWSNTHNGKMYAHIPQIPALSWRSIPLLRFGLESNRWLIVLCAFVFFAFFGFADEARQHYRLAFKSLATRVGFSTSSLTVHGSSHGTSSLPYMTNKGDVTVSVVRRSGNKCDSIASFTDQLSIPSISLGNDLKSDLKIEECSPSDSATSSFVELGPQGLSNEPVVALPAVPPVTILPHVESAQPAVPAYSSDVANAV